MLIRVLEFNTFALFSALLVTLSAASTSCKGSAARFISCEKKICAARPHANLSYTCEGCLKTMRPRFAMIIFSCERLGKVLIFIHPNSNKTDSNGTLSLHHYALGSQRFVVTAIVSDVTEEENDIQCSLKTESNPNESQERVFQLCVAKQEDSSRNISILTGCSVGAIVLLLVALVFVYHFQYELLYQFRRLKHFFKKEEYADMTSPQIVIIHSSRKRHDIATLITELEGTFFNITCTSYLDGLAGQEVGDNAQITIRKASVVVVIIDSQAFEEEPFTHALALCLELPHLTRVYVWRKDVKVSFIRKTNMILAANLKTETHSIWDGKRCITWSGDSAFPRKQLVTRLRLVLPLQAVLHNT